jgi:hypothetical protein
VDCRPLGLDIELPRASDPKTIIGSLRILSLMEAVLVNHIFVSFCVMQLIVNIPTEGLKEWVNELNPDFGLIQTVFVDSGVAGEMLNKIQDDFRRSHMVNNT